ncbi:MAG: HAD-IB family phosphatase [Sphingobacteriaceae bacterium]|nr:HAD-IB family phosphatase [Sphingobacteriaceae bacterium]
MSKTLVLFDFDGTLTKRDTFPQFVFFSQGYFKGLLGFLIFSPYVFLFLAKLMDGAKLKEKLVAFYFKGQKEEELNLHGKVFIEKLSAESGFNLNVSKKLENYKSQNHTICIVSASLDIWIKPFCESYGIDYLCTELEYLNGISSGKLKTPNCNREEKAVRIKRKYNLVDYSNIIAYGNSGGDKAMFDLATKTNFV